MTWEVRNGVKVWTGDEFPEPTERTLTWYGLDDTLSTLRAGTGRPIRPGGGGKRNTIAKCGTVTGYRRHKRLGEDACAECRAANSRYAQTFQYANHCIDCVTRIRTAATRCKSCASKAAWRARRAA